MDIKLKISAFLAIQVLVIFASFNFIATEMVDEPKQSPSYEQQGISQANVSEFSKIEEFTGLEIQKVSDDSQLFWMFLLVNLGSFAGIASALVITMQKDAKQKIKTEKLSVVGELSARLNHDLRNPLSVIKNGVFILKTELETTDNEKIHSTLEKMNSSVDRMSHQVDDVLNYIRPSHIVKKEHSLCTIIQDSIDRVTIPKDVTINLPKNDCKILCDNEKLEIVFVNLITNAIHALENVGTITITIDDSKDDYISIKVADNGPGMDAETRSQIFDPLFTTKQLGTGLGLPSCKSIIENHGGRIEVESESGIGSVFKVFLPANEF